jgi:hypothetical protein
MHFTTIIALALVPAGALAAPWAQSAAGEWIANNTVYPDVAGGKSTSRVRFSLDPLPLTLVSPRLVKNVHEACTLRDTNFILADGNSCKYWTNPQGGIFHGSKFFTVANHIVQLLRRATAYSSVPSYGPLC